jgi:AI-2E family transporter
VSLPAFSGCEDPSALGFGFDVRAGRGPVGRLLERTHAVKLVQNNEARIREYATGLGTPALNVLRGASTAIVTIFVLAYPAVLEGPNVVTGTLGLLPPQRAKRIQRVTHDGATTVTGYISGNLLISAICGTLTYAVLKISRLPFAGLIAMFAAIADVIPLVGATLGAVVTSTAGFTLLAIPVAGIIQVVLRDVWDHRRGRPKDEPTLGEERTPVDHADPDTGHNPAPDPAVQVPRVLKPTGQHDPDAR